MLKQITGSLLAVALVGSVACKKEEKKETKDKPVATDTKPADTKSADNKPMKAESADAKPADVETAMAELEEIAPESVEELALDIELEDEVEAEITDSNAEQVLAALEAELAAEYE